MALAVTNDVVKNDAVTSDAVANDVDTSDDVTSDSSTIACGIYCEGQHLLQHHDRVRD